MGRGLALFMLLIGVAFLLAALFRGGK
jgi:hypothetical protein